MLEFISQTAEKLGVSEDTVKQLSGAVMRLFKDNAEPEEFEQLRQKVPGTDDALEAAPSDEEAGGGGLLGGLGGGLGGGTIGLMSLFSKFNLTGGQAGDFLNMFTGHLKGKAGDELVQRIVSKVPGLGKFLA